MPRPAYRSHPIEVPMKGLAIEFAMWAAVLLPLALSRSFRQTLSSAAPAAKASLLLIVCGTLAVQAIASLDPSMRQHAAFPVTPWAMYTTPNRMVSYWTLELEHHDGTRTPYPLEWLDRRHVRTLMFRLRLEAGPKRGDGSQGDALDASLTHLLRMYNRRDPQTPAVAITLTSRRQPLRDYEGPDRVPATVEARVTMEHPDATP